MEAGMLYLDKQKKNVKKPRNPSFDFDFEDIFEIP